MLPSEPASPLTSNLDGNDASTLVFLHFLGGSAREWDWVTPGLTGQFACVPIDLPGFGAAATVPGYAVAAMANHVAEAVRALAPRRWLLVGHSMGAKVATVLARRAEDGEAGLGGLSHLVLLAGSPPGPEPMNESRRTTMKGWFAGDIEACRADAQAFIDANVGDRLTPVLNDQAVADVLRMNRAAWLAWLDGGSREDWSDRVGLLQTPALIVAGERDGDLGPAAQASLMAPHFASARLVTLPGTKHLLPMERAAGVAALFKELMGGTEPEVAPTPTLDPEYRTLIGSDRVSARTRDILLARAQPDDPAYRPAVLTLEGLATLRAVVDRVLPQPHDRYIDLAARIDAALAKGPGDGWRFALLPPDREAYGAALRTLNRAAGAAFGTDYPSLDDARRDELLAHAAAGALDVAPDETPSAGLSATQMKLWFEDVRADAVRAYVAHPATLARIGYSGIANGGDGERKQGFSTVGMGAREPWEPEARIGGRP